MREDAFRSFLTAQGYTGNSVASRLSRRRTIERGCGADLDRLDLSDEALFSLRHRLEASGRDTNIVNSLMNAVRTYRRFRDACPRAGRRGA